jgi:hypothetical protein
MNDNARMLGEAYGAMLKSLASAHVIVSDSWSTRRQDLTDARFFAGSIVG